MSNTHPSSVSRNLTRERYFLVCMSSGASDRVLVSIARGMCIMAPSCRQKPTFQATIPGGGGGLTPLPLTDCALKVNRYSQLPL